jgi:carboxyl-terminal processing protease
MDNKYLIRLISGLLLVVVALGGAFWAGTYYAKHNTISAVQPADIDFTVFWKTWNLLNQKFVNGNSTSTEAATDQEKVWGATAGMVAALGDPYTVFLPPEEKKMFEEDIRGNFGGVGMELGMKEGRVTVVAPLPGTPASRAGILAGDLILQVDGKSTDGRAVDQVVKTIRGEVGKTVKLLVGRAGRENFEVTLTRAVISVPSVKTEYLKDSGVFVIHLYNFSEPAADAFRSALREFVDSKTDKLIIDLRGNPGGYLEAAVDIASWFLPEGRVVVKEYHGGKSDDKIHRSRGYDVFTDQLKMAILVDGGSASASEILAGALSEYGKGIMVGEKTFGKGSVQELVDVDGKSSLKVTIAKWLTPQGKSISGNGLEPQVKVAITAEDRAASRDPQLAKAIEVLKNLKK